MNFARKTKKHPEWIWTTFEHKNNAPNCDDIKPDDKTNWNLFVDTLLVKNWILIPVI
jgi:hypothetical protein